MKDLIEALQILVKYGNPYSPTHCEHDTLLVMINPNDVSEEDLVRLDDLGFFPGSKFENCFTSFRYGSA